MAKSRSKDTDEDNVPVEEGTAQSTLDIARFFFDEARPLERKGRKDIQAYENYVMAAIVFARSVLWNIKGEFAGKQKNRKKKNLKEEVSEFKKWIKDHERHPLIAKLISMRDVIIHIRPISSQRPISKTTSQDDFLYYDDEPSDQIREAFEELSEQLGQVESIIKEFEAKYR